MSTKTLRTICEGLNAEPFSQNLTLVKLDSQTPEKLIQTLSNVICWIQSTEEDIDIRSESPDETAIRILNALRIFRYPPPRDIDQIQKWRVNILKGEKSAIYPALEWIFENVDRLKERMYLAKYLIKIEVPLDAQTPAVTQLSNVVDKKMEEFKAIHLKIVETRGDFIRAEDVRNDLKAMNEEKEQLQRKIERSRRKVAHCPDFDKHLQIAAQLHAETERQQELELQQQEQRNALIYVGQRLTRLEKTLDETKRQRDTTDSETLINRLKQEIEVNTYVMNEKLLSNIAIQKSNIEAVQKILSMRNITKDDIKQLKNKIEEINTEIANIVEQRDKKDEAGEDKLVIYRHQSNNIQRKKANIADSLQTAKQELNNIETILEEKKCEIKKKTGKEEIVSSVQYKNYVKKLRNKNNFYKRKKAELEQAKAEIQILERTIELLVQRFEAIKEDCKNKGHAIIETLDEDKTLVLQNQQNRPQTAKPATTNVFELRSMVEELNSQLAKKRKSVQSLNKKFDAFCLEHKKQNELFYASQIEYQKVQTELEVEEKQVKKSIQDLETQLKKKEEELKKNTENLNKIEWIAEVIKSPHQTENTIQSLEFENVECLKSIGELTKQLEEMLRNDDTASQKAMWNGLVEIFRTKINLYRQRNNGERPIGDGLFY